MNAVYSPVFPIGFDHGSDPKSAIMGRPWFEREILNLSKKAIRGEKLGYDLDTDLLYIGFSAMDWIIHDYGPFSQEVMDACLKLDKYLGDEYLVTGLVHTLGPDKYTMSLKVQKDSVGRKLGV